MHNSVTNNDHHAALIWRLIPLLTFLAACSDADTPVPSATTAESHSNEFRAADSLERNQRQHRRFPADNIWWTAYGEDQGWNFRNVHQFFPTVNVYRGGPISELQPNPNPAIAHYLVDTLAGPIVRLQTNGTNVAFG